MQSIILPLIAAIGSDGSGGSTMYEHLATVVEKYSVAGRVHLGKQAGNVGRAATKLPLMGKSLHKTIERSQVKTVKKLSGPVLALVITAFVAHRLLCFCHTFACRRRGLIVLADRYPQSQIPGAYDDTAFPPNAEGGRLVSWLVSQERKAFHWMMSHRPDLVIKLSVDFEAACAHKPDHRRELLARKIAIAPQLTFGGAQLVDIDTSQPLKKVLADTEKAIVDFITARGYHQ